MIYMNKLNLCTRPLTCTEIKAIEFIDGADNRIKINGHWITAVFRDKKCFVNPKAVTI